MLERVKPRLQHANSAVVLSATKVRHHSRSKGGVRRARADERIRAPPVPPLMMMPPHLDHAHPVVSKLQASRSMFWAPPRIITL